MPESLLNRFKSDILGLKPYSNMKNASFIILCLAVIFFASCSKIDLPWHHQPWDPSGPRLDSNRIVFTGNDVIGGYHMDSLDVPTYLGMSLLNEGFVNTSTYLRPARSNDIFELLRSLIGEQLSPLKLEHGKNIVITCGISSEIRGNRTEDGTPFGRMKRYCQALKDSGWSVFILTSPYQNPTFDENGVFRPGYVTGSGWDSAGFLHQLFSINDLIRNQYRTFADGLIDIAADPRLNKFDSQYYQQDRYYLSKKGEKVISDLILPIIRQELLK